MIKPDNITPFHHHLDNKTVKKKGVNSDDITRQTVDTTSSNSSAESAQKKSLSIDDVLQQLNQWRRQKAHPSEPIPDRLWRLIFELATHYGASQIRRLCAISNKQYKSKYQAFYPEANSASATTAKHTLKKAPTTGQSSSQKPPADDPFCEVNIKTKQPVFEALHIPTNTVIAEFVRPDGYVMKIHCLSERFLELINAFYQGQPHDSSHAKA